MNPDNIVAQIKLFGNLRTVQANCKDLEILFTEVNLNNNNNSKSNLSCLYQDVLTGRYMIFPACSKPATLGFIRLFYFIRCVLDRLKNG